MMFKNFRKLLAFLSCVIVFNQYICVAMPPPERGSRPAINEAELIRVFGNPSLRAFDRDRYGNYQVVYQQDSDSRWDYRTIKVMNYAGAFVDNGHDLGLLAALKDLFSTLVDIENQSLRSKKKKTAKIKKISGWAMAIGGSATALTVAEATGLLDSFKSSTSNEQREKIVNAATKIADSAGIVDRSDPKNTEKAMQSVFWGLSKFATLMGNHPYVKYTIMAIGAATFLFSAPFYLQALAKEEEFERDAQNVSELFRNIFKFLRARSYESGNLICYAIDSREIPFYNIFQSNLGTWIGPMNMPNLPNARRDERYFPKFQALTNIMNDFVENQGIPRGLRINERANSDQSEQPVNSSDPCLLM